MAIKAHIRCTHFLAFILMKALKVQTLGVVNLCCEYGILLKSMSM